MQGVAGMALSHECTPLNVVYLSRMLCMHIIWMYEGLQPQYLWVIYTRAGRMRCGEWYIKRWTRSGDYDAVGCPV
jgi:hypothetical protein